MFGCALVVTVPAVFALPALVAYVAFATVPVTLAPATELALAATVALFAVPALVAKVALATVPVTLLPLIFVIAAPLPAILFAVSTPVVLSNVKFASAPNTPASLNCTCVLLPAAFAFPPPPVCAVHVRLPAPSVCNTYPLVPPLILTLAMSAFSAIAVFAVLATFAKLA